MTQAISIDLKRKPKLTQAISTETQKPTLTQAILVDGNAKTYVITTDIDRRKRKNYVNTTDFNRTEIACLLSSRVMGHCGGKALMRSLKI